MHQRQKLRLFQTMLQKPFRLPDLAFPTFKCKVDSNRHKQRDAQYTGAPFVKVTSCLTVANRSGAVEVDGYGVEQAQDGEEGEDSGHPE